MRIPVDFSNEDELRKAFAYITRVGAGRHFGTIPIGWYQIHQCHVLDVLNERAKDMATRLGFVFEGKGADVRVRKGYFEFRFDTKWHGTALGKSNVFRIADARSRK